MNCEKLGNKLYFELVTKMSDQLYQDLETRIRNRLFGEQFYNQLYRGLRIQLLIPFYDQLEKEFKQ